MKSHNVTENFDDDFLWLFSKVDRAAVCLSLNYHVIDLTPKAEALFAVLKKEVLNKPISSLFLFLGLDIIFPDGKKHPIIKASNKDIPLAHKSNKILNLNWEIRPKVGVNGEAVGFIVYTEERTDVEYLSQVYKIVASKEALTEGSMADYAESLSAYLDNIIANMPCALYWKDKNNVFLGCNNNATKFFGLNSRQEIIGMTNEDIEKKADWIIPHKALWRKNTLEVVASGKSKLNIREKSVLMPNGDEVDYITSLAPLFDHKNDVIGVIGVSVDISDIRRAESLRLKKEVAKKTSKYMSTLVGNIAHEIRTPLAIIGINADLLRMLPVFTAAKNEEKNIAENHIENIKYAIKSATHIVNNILTMLRTMSSQELTENKFHSISIAEDIQKLLEVYPFLGSEKSLVKFQSNKIKDFVYCGDRILTQHILFNLVKNSLHAIKEADKGSISISFDEDKTYNILRFTDTALGIPVDVLPEIFEQFETGKKDGAGLGLAFCKMVMESYGGNIACKSKEGEFTDFILSFPKKISSGCS
ncbi:MAG: PAS domain-containing sensor histidine kinase [Gammaproteobacteria bacterium]|nr:PAS domain-containing sensor histidine kinase [Gammaproteobacteria bacterium]